MPDAPSRDTNQAIITGNPTRDRVVFGGDIVRRGGGRHDAHYIGDAIVIKIPERSSRVARVVLQVLDGDEIIDRVLLDVTNFVHHVLIIDSGIAGQVDLAAFESRVEFHPAS